MSSFVANISSFAKIANPKTFDMIMKAAAQPMIQVNIPECYLSLVQDPPPKTTAEERLSQLEKVILPQPLSLTQELQYRPTRLLAAAVWLHLKCKFFNGGTTKEACTTFEVWAQTTVKSCCWVKFTLVDPLELPRAHISGLTLQPMREMWLVTSLPLHPPPRSKCSSSLAVAVTGGTKMGFIYDYT